MQILRIGAYALAAVLKWLATAQLGFADMMRVAAERLETWADNRRMGP